MVELIVVDRKVSRYKSSPEYLHKVPFIVSLSTTVVVGRLQLGM